MNKLKILLFFFLFSFTGSVIIILFYPKIHPLAGIKQSMSADRVKARAQKIADQLNFSKNGHEISTSLRGNRALIRQAQQVLGLEKSNQVLRKGVPGYYWQMRWHKSEGSKLIIGEKNQEEILSSKLGNLAMKLDMHGNLLELNAAVADTISLPVIDETEAKTMVEAFIKRFSSFKSLQADTLVETTILHKAKSNIEFDRASGLKFESQKKTVRSNRTDYEFSYSDMDSYLNDKIQVTVLTSGNIISNFEVKYVIPEAYLSGNVNILRETAEGISILIFIILFAVFGFKRMRAYEIGFKMAIILGIFVTICFGIEIYLQMQETLGWEMIIALTIGPLMIGGAFTVVWAVSESIGREVWKEKFAGLDLLINGHFLHSKLGENILRGVALGIAFLAGWLLLLRVSGQITKPFIFPFDNNDIILAGANSALYILIQSICTNIFMAAIFLIFVLSLLKKRIASSLLLVICTALGWGLIHQGDIRPGVIGIPVEILISVLFIWAFLRYDFLTSFLALFTFIVWYHGAALFYMQNESAFQSGYGLMAFMSFFVVVGLIAIATRDQVSDFDAITPAFVRHITERQRLQGELAVAREVQMSFLPRKNPQISGLEITSKCLPANEIGGDYFDFLELGKNKLGIIVGDVSGKSTQAAFYMTLTKGFLKALVKSIQSPVEMLIQMNNLFFDNVKRGHFISMIYGVFDVEAKTLTLARAGHNPLMVKHAQSGTIKFFDQPGIALGLEKGEIFAQNIKEEVIPFNKDDLFVFYTDGFTEAMNKDKEEFGEQRLLASMADNSSDSARQHLERVFTEVKKFMGKALQQDDMTMVIVKIT